MQGLDVTNTKLVNGARKECESALAVDDSHGFWLVDLHVGSKNEQSICLPPKVIEVSTSSSSSGCW